MRPFIIAVLAFLVGNIILWFFIFPIFPPPNTQNIIRLPKDKEGVEVNKTEQGKKQEREKDRKEYDILNGHQWFQLSSDKKVAYLKGIGNMADFIVATYAKKDNLVSTKLVNQLSKITIAKVIKDIEYFYTNNKDDYNKSVIEVILLLYN